MVTYRLHHKPNGEVFGLRDYPPPEKLNLGCGRFPLRGYRNVDLYPAPRVDELVNLESFPWPWEDESFDEVYASQVLEHLGPLPEIMREIHRVLKPNGLLVARVPLGLRWLYDPAHKHAFSKRTLRAYIADNAGLQSGAFFAIESERVSDWEMPFRWHVKTYLPSVHRLLVTDAEDGKERMRFPLGRRMELTVRMRKRERIAEA